MFRIEPVTSENRDVAVGIRVRSEQEAYVATVLESLEEADATPTSRPKPRAGAWDGTRSRPSWRRLGDEGGTG